MKFTDSKIRSLKAPKSRQIIWEDGETAMGLRISPAGRKSFIYMYRFSGKARMMTIGPYPRIGLATARVRVAQAKEKLAKDIDPGKEWLIAKHADRSAYIIKDLVAEYLEKWAIPRKKSWKEDQRILNKDVIPAWGRRKAKDIEKRDVVLLLDEVMERGAPIQANNTFAVIRKMFNFAMSRSILDTSPCFGVSAPAKPKQRDRVLSETEINKFWGNLENSHMEDQLKSVLRLILVTAQRKGEIVNAEWNEINFKEGWWTIPSEKSKNGLPHRVPLSHLAKALLTKIQTKSNGSDFIFASSRKNRQITEQAVDHAVRRNRVKLGIEDFTPHDLRRTAASQMTASGIPRLVVSKILNHAEKGVTAVYDRHSYDEEKRIGLNQWGKALTRLIK
jgi:integrase